MKQLLLLLALISPSFAKLPVIDYAGMFFSTVQVTPGQAIRKVSTLPATCTAVGSASSSNAVLYQGMVYHCTSSNTWSALLTTASGVSSITGTADEITASASVGAVTLSLPDTVILGNARTGSWPAATAHAFFGHNSLNHSAAGNYALLQISTGQTIVNAATGQTINFRINNSTSLSMAATSLTFTDAVNLVFGTTTGTKIGTATSQKIGFFNSTPIVQPSSTGQTAGFTAGAGTAAKDDSTYTGGVGSTAYTTGDIVRHLKNLGLIAQ